VRDALHGTRVVNHDARGEDPAGRDADPAMRDDDRDARVGDRVTRGDVLPGRPLEAGPRRDVLTAPRRRLPAVRPLLSPPARDQSPRLAALPALLLPPPVVPELSIQPNTHVTLDYELFDAADGELLDASDADDGERIEYVHGYGMLVPGLEAALAGLHAGDEREVLVPAEAGYGERDEDLVMEIDKGDLPEGGKVEVGDELVAESPEGDEIAMTVVELKDKTVVVDANHPLAGVSLRYQVKVVTVREATTDEIEQAASELDDAHEHVHGPDCDHEHHEHVQLGKKLN
jgi:FKBP-type peptidyl-prolyl cis-trans isomerase SlyD